MPKTMSRRERMAGAVKNYQPSIDKLAWDDFASDTVAFKEECEGLRDELQEWIDNMPENLQGGGKAEEITAAIEQLEEAINACDEIENMDNPTEKAEEAIAAAEGVDFPAMR